MPASEVRLARGEDFGPLLALLKLRHEEDGIGRFDESRVLATLIKGIARDMAVIGVIRSGSGDIEASIGLFTAGWWYNTDTYITDLWNFVAPDHRKTTHAKRLLEFAKEAAVFLKRPLIMSKVLNERTEAMLRLYGRQLPKGGEFFVFRPPVAA